MQQRRGFTLIELLVVIAVIEILAAILFPVFAQARAKARQATCQSNLHQLGFAILAYAQDYDETLPLLTYTVNGTTRLYPWQYVIDPYVRASFPERTDLAANRRLSIYVCPEYGKTADGTTANQPSNSYRGDANLMSANALTDGRPPIHSLAALEFHASLVLLGPNSGYCTGNSGDDTNRGYNPNAAGSFCNRDYMVARMRHSDGANYLLLDGHVKWYRAPTPYDAVSMSGVV